MVELPDGAPTRITMSLQDGYQTVVDTVCHSLGIGVSHLVLIHMDGLRSLVNDEGGINVQAPVPERDTVTGLVINHPGLNNLNGSQALAYARSRHLEYLENGVWIPAPTAADERSGRDAAVLAQVGAEMGLTPLSPIASVQRLWDLSGVVTTDTGANPLVLSDIAHALEHLNSATHVVLPITLHPGAVPTADLNPGGPALLEQFGGTTPNCSIRMPLSSPPPATTPGSVTDSGRTT